MSQLLANLKNLNIPTSIEEIWARSPQGQKDITTAQRAHVAERKRLTAESVRIESERKKFQAEITKHEKEIRTSMQALEKQKTVLSPAAYKQKAGALQQRIAGVQRRVQGRRVVLEKAFAGAVNTFRKTLLDIVKKSARGRKLDLVMDKSQILYVAPKLDITKSILLDLNKRLPTLKVRIPSRTATKKSK